MRAEDRPHLPRLAPIDAYGNGGFRFAEMSHRGSLMCLPSGIWGWPVSDARALDAQAFAPVIDEAAAIDIFILGTGADAVALDPPLRRLLRERGLGGIEVMATGPAVRIYNVVVGEGRRVAAALIAV